MGGTDSEMERETYGSSPLGLSSTTKAVWLIVCSHFH